MVVNSNSPQCRYDRYLLGDAIIGLYHSERTDFKQSLLDQAEEYYKAYNFQIDFKEETVACSLL